MAKRTRKAVTPEAVAEVRATKEKYPEMTLDELGRLCDFSGATISRILNGFYDQEAKDGTDEADTVSSVMELHDTVKELGATLNELTRTVKTLSLAMAVIIDPVSGKTNAQVADALRKCVRGEAR